VAGPANATESLTHDDHRTWLGIDGPDIAEGVGVAGLGVAQMAGAGTEVSLQCGVRAGGDGVEPEGPAWLRERWRELR
jgi:hypothetical protein